MIKITRKNMPELYHHILSSNFIIRYYKKCIKNKVN